MIDRSKTSRRTFQTRDAKEHSRTRTNFPLFVFPRSTKTERCPAGNDGGQFVYALTLTLSAPRQLLGSFGRSNLIRFLFTRRLMLEGASVRLVARRNSGINGIVFITFLPNPPSGAKRYLLPRFSHGARSPSFPPDHLGSHRKWLCCHMGSSHRI